MRLDNEKSTDLTFLRDFCFLLPSSAVGVNFSSLLFDDPTVTQSFVNEDDTVDSFGISVTDKQSSRTVTPFAFSHPDTKSDDKKSHSNDGSSSSIG